MISIITMPKKLKIPVDTLATFLPYLRSAFIIFIIQSTSNTAPINSSIQIKKKRIPSIVSIPCVDLDLSQIFRQ